MPLSIHNIFSKKLASDKILDNYQRQVVDACFSYVTPSKTKSPFLIHYAKDLIEELGISEEEITSKEFLNIITGNKVLEETAPYAMCYGGHQFGHWAGQLGDGRAINLFETCHNGKQWAFQLKGAGKTPYSRTADGLAVMRSSIREYLCSEAMYYLGIPTTRALSLSLSGDQVLRDVLYDGNSAYEKGSIVCRVSESFVRFGNFEILSARKNVLLLEQLANYTIEHLFPKITTTGKQKYIDLLREVQHKTIDMIVHWQRVGFVHGVMNTDNMSIIGQTIDYGPYGWIEGYDLDFTPNTTDNQHKRYRFGNQPYIGLWNLYKLANALYPLINDVEPLEAILNTYEKEYQIKYEKMMCQKLGILPSNNSKNIIEDLENTLQLIETDYTIFFRNLASVNKNHTTEDAISIISNAFYNINELKSTVLQSWEKWVESYINIIKLEVTSDEERLQQMNSVNPKYIFRNYMAQLAIEESEKNNYSLIDELYTVLKNPYDEQPLYEKWFAKRPEWARNKVGCSMLSCSS